MNRGDRVRVQLLTNVENWMRGKTGIVIADSVPGEVLLVEFDDEAVTHQFLAEELELID